MDPEDLCDQWFAYTATNLKEAEPTVEALEAMERKEYAKCIKRNIITPTSSKVNKSTSFG